MKKLLLLLPALAIVIAGCGQPAPAQLDCKIDSDCIFVVPAVVSQYAPCSEALVCDPRGYGCKFYDAADENVAAVSKGWKKCPGEEPKAGGCPECLGGISEKNYEPKCVNNSCLKVKK